MWAQYVATAISQHCVYVQVLALNVSEAVEDIHCKSSLVLI